VSRLSIEAPGQLEAEIVTLEGSERLLMGRLPETERLPLEMVGKPTSSRSLSIASPNVSANHALVWSQGSDVVIQDLNSRNGTWVRVPRGQALRVSGGEEVQVKLAPATWVAAPDQYPESVRYQNATDFGASMALAIRTWLSQHDEQVHVWCISAGESASGTTVFRLGNGEFLCLRPERTVDGSFQERVARLARYVSTQNALYAAEEQTRGDGIILASPGIRQVHRRIVELALQSLPSLILLGPSGTGKERLAQAFHRGLGRAGAFVAVNCATLTRERVVVDLFGAEAGAYTDAKRTMIGAVERADGGTLFLDEIGELPLDVQPMLLRFLETGEYQRLGGVGRARFADVRVVAATNRDLRRMTQDGAFREDLFFRLALEIVEVPALRERFADVVAYFRSQMLGPISAFDALAPTGLALLETYGWAGNFRELVNLVRRLPRSAEPGTLDASLIRRALEAGSLSSVPPPSPLARQISGPASPSSFPDWLLASAAAFAEEFPGSGPSAWTEVTTFIELYLKPWALAHLAGVQDADGFDGVAVGRIAELVKADRGTVLKQLRRYFECRRQPNANR